MTKYILTWTVTKTIPAQCPDYQPDPYTGQYPMTHCLVYHCKTVTEQKTNEFESEKTAKEFAKGAPQSCTNFRLNGELLEDIREKETITILDGGSLVGNEATTISGTNSVNIG